MLFKVSGPCRLTRDVELRYTSAGTAVAKVGLATSQKYGDKEEKCFIDANVWGKAGELWNQHLSKGDQVYIVAELNLNQWQDQDGQKRSKHELNVREFEFIGNRSSNGEANNQGQQCNEQQIAPAQSNNNQTYHESGASGLIDDDDIPFAYIDRYLSMII